MNGYTELIAKVSKVSIEEASQIQKFIDENAMIDWSESSSRKIASVAAMAKAVMKAGGWEAYLLGN